MTDDEYRSLHAEAEGAAMRIMDSGVVAGRPKDQHSCTIVIQMNQSGVVAMCSSWTGDDSNPLPPNDMILQMLMAALSYAHRGKIRMIGVDGAKVQKGD